MGQGRTSYKMWSIAIWVEMEKKKRCLRQREAAQRNRDIIIATSIIDIIISTFTATGDWALDMDQALCWSLDIHCPYCWPFHSSWNTLLTWLWEQPLGNTSPTTLAVSFKLLGSFACCLKDDVPPGLSHGSLPCDFWHLPWANSPLPQHWLCPDDL